MKNEGSALLKVELQLIAAEACFQPPLSGDQRPSVRQFFMTWIESYLECSHLVKRLDGQAGMFLGARAESKQGKNKR